jgi:glucose/arabinose dehydrogenase/plastocyanin
MKTPSHPRARSLSALLLLIAAMAVGQGPLSAQACPPVTAQPSVVSEDNAFDTTCIAVPAGEEVALTLENRDRFAHNLSVYRSEGGEAFFTGEYLAGFQETVYKIGAVEAGEWYFRCDIHPSMEGIYIAAAAGTTPQPSGSVGGERRAPTGATVTLERVATGLTAPVFVTAPDDGTDRLFIVDQPGQIHIVKDGATLETPFLNIADRLVQLNPEYDERGLLGLAFHPLYRENGRFFVYYSAPLRDGAAKDWDHTARLAEFKVSASNPDVADPASHRVVLEVDQPQGNHNGGHIAFGPDGMLYIPLGDGGKGNDVGPGHAPEGNGQNMATLLGKVLRIDIDAEEGRRPYGVPEDNPFVGTDGVRPEIYASGFRNPYHLSFDAEGGALYVGDSGQDRFEEVSIVTAGGNYGWRIKEGTHCFDPDAPSNPPATCPDTAEDGKELIDPIIEYSHEEIASSVIVGGYIYRGSRAPSLAGQYIFGDYSRDRTKPQGVLFSASKSGEGLWPIRELRAKIDDGEAGDLGRFVLSFGEDADHELYVTVIEVGGPTGVTGVVYRFAGATGAPRGVTDDDDGGLPWWAWLVGLVALVLIVALAVRGSRPTDGRGDPSTSVS